MFILFILHSDTSSKNEATASQEDAHSSQEPKSPMKEDASSSQETKCPRKSPTKA